MASGSHFNRYRTSGAAYARDTWQQLHRHGAGASGAVWSFLLAYPALVQGVYYVLTGLWPLVHLKSFLIVTGPKHDVWLVQTVGLLVTVIGAALCLAAYRRQRPPEVLVIALGSAAVLAGVNIYFVLAGQIPAIYLLDAVAELAILALWACVWYYETSEKTLVVSSPTAAANGRVPAGPTA